jgi:branched-subunit amino acid ABC-type transport system permease component
LRTPAPLRARTGPTRRSDARGIVPLLSALLVALVVLGLSLTFAPPAGAATPTDTPTEGATTEPGTDDGTADPSGGGVCVFPENDDNQIHIKGCLRDQRSEPPTPVEGVTVTVLGPGGDVVEEVVTDSSGVFDVALPGTIDVPGLGNITIILGVVAAFVVGAIFGLANDLALWGPLRRRGTGLIAMMIVSIGLSIFLRSVFQYLVGGQNRNYSQYSSVEPWSIGQVLITPRDIAVAAIALVALIGVSALLQYTRLGKATRAVADNPALASSSGINVERVIGAVWTVGGGLAALSGVLLGITQGFNFQLGFKMLLLVFAATVLGGLGTIWGAMVGALVIGTFVEVSTLFIPSELKYVGALVILIAVLLVRPQGLLGRAERVG